MDRRRLASAALSGALRMRQRADVSLTSPLNPIDVAERLGVQVWLQEVGSLEGMLVRAPHPVVLLSSLRPAGRIAFTCAHELGHYWLGHDGHVDPFSDDPFLREDSDDEYQANQFAAYLLMPKTTVQHGFARRNVDLLSATPTEVLAVAHWLGVGYSALVQHLRFNLRLVDHHQGAALARHSPKRIVGALPPDVTQPRGASVFLVDRHFVSRPVDLSAGDVAVLDGPVEVSGDALALHRDLAGRSYVIGVQPGTGHIDGGEGWSTYVRVSRARFAGRSIFRHLEEEADE